MEIEIEIEIGDVMNVPEDRLRRSCLEIRRDCVVCALYYRDADEEGGKFCTELIGWSS